MNMPLTSEILGVRAPDSMLAKAAIDLASEACPEFLFNHSVRTYFLGAHVLKAQGAQFDEEACFVAAILHDVGIVAPYRSEDMRFEVDSADVAREFLAKHNVAEDRQDRVWDAIALHTTTGIPQAKGPDYALVQIGAGMDVLGIGVEDLDTKAVAGLIEAFPRTGFMKAFKQAILDYAHAKPMAQIMTWTSDIAHAHSCDFGCPTASNLFDASPWNETE